MEHTGTKALHAFADRGVESEVLNELFDEVYRITLDLWENECSKGIECDVADFVDDPTQFGFEEDVTFDLVLAQPPCTKWSTMVSISGDADDHPNLIPLARKLCKTYGDHYIIENKPEAPLQNATVLNGKMFNMNIVYKRAFETSFDVTAPTFESGRETEVSPYFSADRSREWWAMEKQYDAFEYPKQHLAKNCIPRQYLTYLLQAYLRNTIDDYEARSTHN